MEITSSHVLLGRIQGSVERGAILVIEPITWVQGKRGTSVPSGKSVGSSITRRPPRTRAFNDMARLPPCVSVASVDVPANPCLAAGEARGGQLET